MIDIITNPTEAQIRHAWRDSMHGYCIWPKNLYDDVDEWVAFWNSAKLMFYPTILMENDIRCSVIMGLTDYRQEHKTAEFLYCAGPIINPVGIARAVGVYLNAMLSSGKVDVIYGIYKADKVIERTARLFGFKQCRS